MNNATKRIVDVLKHKGLVDLEHRSREELIDTLLTYHEELIYQNEELRRINEHLQSLQNKYEVLFHSEPVATLVLNSDFEIVEFNQRSREIWDMIGQSVPLSSLIHKKSQNALHFYQNRLRQDSNLMECELQLNTHDGEKYAKVLTTPLSGENGRLYLCSLVDITQEKEHEKRIHALSIHDALTGLYNRYFFTEEIKRLNTKRNLPITILMADVNGLKIINDTFGHVAGDEFLIKTAVAIKNELRKDEIVARLGGDEFACIFTKMPEAAVQSLVERLEEKCSRIVVRELNLSVAFGYAQQRFLDEDINDIIRQAEDKMYQKKMIMTVNNQKKIVQSLVSRLQEKYPKEELHAKNVAKMMKQYCLGNEEGSGQAELYETAGLLHDIGKVAIDYSVLELKRELSEKEWEEVRKHPEIGYRILKSTDSFLEIKDIILHHHENFDGTGYPKHLYGEQIPYASRVLTVCDAYDAMTTDRPYRKAMSPEDAILELKKCAGTQFDPFIVEKFLYIMQEAKEY